MSDWDGMGPVHQDGDEREATCPEHGAYRQLFKANIGGRGEWRGWCVPCNDRKVARWRAEEAEQVRRDRVRECVAHSEIVGRFELVSFDSFEITSPAQRKAVATCMAFVEAFNPKAGGSLVLMGPPGVGKTHLVSAIGLALCHRGMSALFVVGTEIVRRVRWAWKRDGGTEDAAIRELVSPDLLIVDEIGLVSASEAEQRILFDVIDGRYRKAKPIAITTNLNLPQLQAAVGERIADRLAENATVIALTGESYRRRRA